MVTLHCVAVLGPRAELGRMPDETLILMEAVQQSGFPHYMVWNCCPLVRATRV